MSLVLAAASFAAEAPIPVIFDTHISTDCDVVASAAELTQILIVVGPSTHPPGSHKVAAGARLMAHCLERADNLRNIEATVVSGWPDDDELLTRADSIIFIGDTFPPQRLPGTQKILARIERMMQRGCGIVCVHYATALLGQDVAADGDHPLLQWMGGYFANKTCPHHPGISRIFEAATIEPAAPQHPISRGWSEFTLHDEPYINNYFGKNDNQPAAKQVWQIHSAELRMVTRRVRCNEDFGVNPRYI